jgi:hypothetical protein
LGLTSFSFVDGHSQIIPSGDEPLGLQAPLDVRKLILKTALHSNEYCGIKFMLRSSPRLETLTIDIGPARIFPVSTLAEIRPPFSAAQQCFFSE